MSPLVIATIFFSCILGAAVVGLVVGPRLPSHHLESKSQDVVRLAMAMIATMAALVLGLVTGSAKSAFDAEDAAIKSTSASLLSLDRMLAAYGPQTKEIRASIQSALAAKLLQIWPEDRSESALQAPTTSRPSELIVGQILKLTHKTMNSSGTRRVRSNRPAKSYRRAGSSSAVPRPQCRRCSWS